MARLPRLSPAAEHRLLKFLCGLPPSVQRRIFGRPPRVEGQTLATDVHVLLRIAKLARGDGLADGLEVEAARAQRRREAEIVGHRPEIPMGAVEEVEIAGPGGAIAARRYVPPNAETASAPLLVYYHGGGWVIGDLETHDSPCRFLAARSGVQVLAIDYRLAPEHPFPGAVEDASAAYAWAQAEAARLGCDPRRIGVGGDSAGANLAAAVSLLAMGSCRCRRCSC